MKEILKTLDACANTPARLMSQAIVRAVEGRQGVRDVVWADAEAPSREWLEALGPLDDDTDVAAVVQGFQGTLSLPPAGVILPGLADGIVLLQVKEALKHEFNLRNLKMLVLTGSTRDTLQRVLNEDRIQHVLPEGHGSWSDWKDARGKRIKNDLNFPKARKKSVVRLTCGKPGGDNAFEDQFLAPASENVFGHTRIVNVFDNVMEPLHVPTLEEFDRDKNYSSLESHVRFQIKSNLLLPFRAAKWLKQLTK